MKSVVIGLSFGNLYVDILKKLGHQVITCDTHKPANYWNIYDVLSQHKHFDTVHICTPNHTHQAIAELFGDYADLIFVEKPGFSTPDAWQSFQNNYKAKLIMTKNNMWRDNINEIIAQSQISDFVKINWINKNRIPSPGSWFTDKEKSFGGVSRDLLPHLLSLFISINPKTYKNFQILNAQSEQRWDLSTCGDTDYGSIIKDGNYNVDDFARIELTDNETKFIITSDWKSNQQDDIAMHFYKNNQLINTIPLGLCPESAYQNMILDCISNLQNDEFWQKQFEYDCWIQEKIQL